MRLDAPRIPPLPEEEWNDEQREQVGRFETGRRLNIFRTLVRHQKLLKRWGVFANHVLNKSSLTARDREILILRTAWLCRGEYEWGQHVRIGREAGLGDEDLARIVAGSEAAGLDAKDALLLRMVDELHAEQYVRTATWRGLERHFSEQQLLDALFTVGQYTMLAMALNSLGVQLEDGVRGFGRDLAPTAELDMPKRP